MPYRELHWRTQGVEYLLEGCVPMLYPWNRPCR